MSKKITRHVQSAISKYKELIDTDQLNTTSIANACMDLGVCRNSLQQGFKEKYGITIREYKLKVKMEKARQMIAAGKEVKAIAITLDYENTSNFTAAFKKYYGLTPTAINT